MSRIDKKSEESAAANTKILRITLQMKFNPIFRGLPYHSRANKLVVFIPGYKLAGRYAFLWMIKNNI